MENVLEKFKEFELKNSETITGGREYKVTWVGSDAEGRTLYDLEATDGVADKFQYECGVYDSEIKYQVGDIIDMDG